MKNQAKEAALVAFIAPGEEDWRFSLVRLDHSLEVQDGKLKSIEELTPARRWSFLVGEHEGSHTVQARFLNLLTVDESPNLAELENAFNIEVVTKEFFSKYVELFHRVRESLEVLIKKDTDIAKDFKEKDISAVDFAKKTLGQMAFLYFLQKKGWFGVAPGAEWGTGRKNFLRELFERRNTYGKNFFDDILEPLFYEALAQDRGREAIYPRLNNCRMPFLNGGLFEPMRGYSWATTHILLEDEIFSNKNKTKDGDIGDGILDVFDRYNFTVNENEPLEKEVAVDPEMLGKVFENLLEIKDRKSKGTFYTPREIVHYMCQETLINHLFNEMSGMVSREDLQTLVHKGSQILQNDLLVIEKGKEGTYKFLTPQKIRNNAVQLDRMLEHIKVCDPAVGSGAFPLGMLTEIVQVRQVLAIHLNSELSIYDLKLHCISSSLYGVDIDSGAVEIAKLRLWLALVVEENVPHPLPNLEHKLMQGNSLISEYEGIKLFDESLLETGAQKMVQLGMNFGTDSERKLERLSIITERFIHESQRTKKQELRDEINLLKWELIELTLQEQKQVEKLNDIRRLRQKNSRPFFIWKLEFSDVFQQKGGFDVVIANPPYVGESKNKDIFRPIAKGNLKNFYLGKMDLFYFFFHLALDLGKEMASCAFITTNYFLTASGARKLREDLSQRSTIRNLVNFNELKIFESALGQHNVITIFDKGTSSNVPAQTSQTKRTGVANDKILLDIVNQVDKSTEYELIPQAELFDGNEKYIRLHGTSNKENPIEIILNKVQAQGEPLSKFFNINQGVVSGCDYVSGRNIQKLSAPNDVKKKDGIFVLDLKNLRDVKVIDSFNEDERKLLRPFFKNSEIGRYWRQKKPSKYFIYYQKELDNKKYPNIYSHLEKYREILEARLEAYNESYHWTALHRSREESIFTQTKIVVPYRCKVNIFSLSEEEWFCRSDCYVITPKSESDELKYALALLNSKLYFNWLYRRGKRKGETLELFHQPLSEIPIKMALSDNRDLFISIVDEILTITLASDYDPQKTPVKQKELEAKIDHMVFDLYGLSAEEREIVLNS